MINPCPITTSTADADVVAIGAASAPFATLVMATGKWYRLSTNAACWFEQGAAPTAHKNTAPSVFLAAGDTVLIDGALGAKLAVIQDGASTGFASLARVRIGR